jgi:hypothetical protein
MQPPIEPAAVGVDALWGWLRSHCRSAARNASITG